MTDDLASGESDRCEATVILSYPRCGTHLLEGLLGSHPRVEALGEIINRHDTASKFSEGCSSSREIVDKLLALADEKSCHPVAVVHAAGLPGFDHPCFDDHPDAGKFGDLPEHFEGRVNVVILMRNNLLERFNSFAQAQRSGQWADREGDYRYREMEIDPLDMERDFTYMEGAYQKMASLCPAGLSLYYEGLCSGGRGALLRGVMAFMGLDYQPLSPATHKQSRGVAQELKYFRMLHDYFRGTAWERFFENMTEP